MSEPKTNLFELKKASCEKPLISNSIYVLGNQKPYKPMKVVYFTDPICSSCWGVEPQLRKLKLQYGDLLEIEYHMGGLLPDWSYDSGGISKPSDVAKHWDEASEYYNMPIDGDLWLEDPLESSYPPSIAFKAAQLQDEKKAIRFLRRIREMVFLEKKNICKWEYLQLAASQCKLDTHQLRIDFEGKAKELFEDDLQLSKQYKVRGFPTFFFTDNLNNPQVVYGSRPYSTFVEAISNSNMNIPSIDYDKSWQNLFAHYPTLTTREFSELKDIDHLSGTKILNQLLEEGSITQFRTKNGSLWKMNN